MGTFSLFFEPKREKLTTYGDFLKTNWDQVEPNWDYFETIWDNHTTIWDFFKNATNWEFYCNRLGILPTVNFIFLRIVIFVIKKITKTY